jgi:hypothetical protein
MHISSSLLLAWIICFSVGENWHKRYALVLKMELPGCGINSNPFCFQFELFQLSSILDVPLMPTFLPLHGLRLSRFESSPLFFRCLHECLTEFEPTKIDALPLDTGYYFH